MNSRNLICFGLGLLVSFSCGNAEVIARVGSVEVQKQELESMLPEIAPDQMAEIKGNRAAQGQIARQVLIQQVLYEKAVEAGWDENSEVLKRLEQLRKTLVAESYLSAVSQVPESYPNESEISVLYEANLASLKTPAQYNLAQIYLPVSPGNVGESEADRIQAIHAELKETPELFAELADRYSEANEGQANGGLIGWVTLDKLQPEFRRVVVSMEPGEVSAPLLVEGGWHIIECRDVIGSRTLELDEVRDVLAERLRAERAMENRRAYLGSLLEQNPIAINEVVLGDLFEGPEGN